MTTAAIARPSLRRRLLVFLLIPMAALLVLDALLSYGVALGYANRVHDHDLGDNARVLAKLISSDQFGSRLTRQARFLLEYDPDGRGYFSVRSQRYGLLAGDDRLPGAGAVPDSDATQLANLRLDGRDLRAATVQVPSQQDPSDRLVVTVAETLHERHEQAREILLLATLTQGFLIGCLLLLVWFGVTHGLRVLDPLTARLAARKDELTPLDGADVPQEIQPLTRTIDALFARLRSMLALHDRFIADAAHQLRTPLTGLSLHVERALADPSQETVADALSHIQQLVQRAARTSSQLLALTRAQAVPQDNDGSKLIELDRLVPEAVTLRVHEAIRAGVDLGYEGDGSQLRVRGDAASLQDMLDNLIDNAMRYAGRGSIVTVRLRQRADGGVDLVVEDNGPGVTPEQLPRLSERFFRAAANGEEGSGLGLAIVLRIAERHHAALVFGLQPDHGLVVEVQFPPAAGVVAQ